MAAERTFDGSDRVDPSPGSRCAAVGIAAPSRHPVRAPEIVAWRERLESSFGGGLPEPAIGTWPGPVRVLILVGLTILAWSPAALLLR